MPNNTVLAAVEGLPLNRRNLLLGLATVPTVAAATAVAVDAPASAHSRMMFHLAEFKKAAEEIFDIQDWDDLALDGFWPNGKWKGAPMIVGNRRKS